MNTRVYILFAAWIGVGVAFYVAHPIAYTIILIGLTASTAIAAEDLRDTGSGERTDSAGAARGPPRGAPTKVAVTRMSLPETDVLPSSTWQAVFQLK